MTRKINHEERAAELLEAAATVLDERGWYQGDLINPYTGSVCAVGAVRAAAGMEDVEARPRTRAYALAVEALADLMPLDQISRIALLFAETDLERHEDIIACWNDTGLRDKEIVRDGFLHAAKDLRNKVVPA
jgi:hypothetical protein